MCNSKFKLAIVVLWNENIHGVINTNEFPNSKTLSQYFINEGSVYPNEFYNKQDYKNIKKFITDIKNRLVDKIDNNIFNVYDIIIFEKLIARNQIGLQIVEEIEINNYNLCVLKTHWIKLVQRKWRNILKKRKAIQKYIFNVKYKEIYGHFPKTCNIPFKLGI
jgi:hypothetical protein